MNFTMFLQIIILVMSCTSSITNIAVTDITDVTSVGVPIHTVVSGGRAGMLHSYPYELIEPYYCMPESEWNYYGALYIEPDGTLWRSDVDNGRLESKSKKMAENINSVVHNPAELITILKTDGSVWIIPDWIDFYNINALDAYENLKLADDNNIGSANNIIKNGNTNYNKRKRGYNYVLYKMWQ